MDILFETLEMRRLLSGDDLIARHDELTTREMSSAEVAAMVAEADADDASAVTSWGGENHWFQSSDGDVYALWHGGAAHDPEGDGRYQWNLTNLTDAAGVPSGFQPGTLSATFTPWRAMNIVGLDADGDVVTYWWSPESGERGLGARGNGWCLTDLSDSADFTEVDGGGGDRGAFSGYTVTRMAGRDDHTIQIIVDDDFADDRTIVISFTPNQPSRDGSPWVARHHSYGDLRDDDDRHGRDRGDDHDRGRDDDHDRDHNGVLVLFGDSTIEADETVTRNIRIIDGTLTVLGTVRGNIRQTGPGSVVVEGGLVTGNIHERGDGGITIIDASVDGNLLERHDGSIAILGDSVVRGNVEERGSGDIDVDGAATVRGNISQRGDDHDEGDDHHDDGDRDDDDRDDDDRDDDDRDDDDRDDDED